MRSREARKARPARRQGFWGASGEALKISRVACDSTWVAPAAALGVRARGQAWKSPQAATVGTARGQGRAPCPPPAPTFPPLTTAPPYRRLQWLRDALRAQGQEGFSLLFFKARRQRKSVVPRAFARAREAHTTYRVRDETPRPARLLEATEKIWTSSETSDILNERIRACFFAWRELL